MCIKFQPPSSNSLGDIDVWKALGRVGPGRVGPGQIRDKGIFWFVMTNKDVWHSFFVKSRNFFLTQWPLGETLSLRSIVITFQDRNEAENISISLKIYGWLSYIFTSIPPKSFLVGGTIEQSLDIIWSALGLKKEKK